jgi:N6-L-threonylcarbamoyladenine synthase
MKILGIETSCDETAISLIEAEGGFPGRAGGPDFSYTVLGNALYSQAALHAEYGGVFPNLAKREHLKNLPILLADVQKQTGNVRPDAIALTVGPGLEPCLWTGITFVQRLAAEWGVPVVAVNHMEGHIIMSLVTESGLNEFSYPVLSLLISGGHTELVFSKAFGQYELIGETRDDAAGEAFDKVARLLELGYPGGPEISKLAAQAREAGIKGDFSFTRPMLHEKNYDFSFSGLKTAVRNLVQGRELTDEFKMQVAREFEECVADVLIQKTLRAVEEYGVSTVVVGGGVSANTYIREQLAQALAAKDASATLLVPPGSLATDNALMIALAGYFHAQKGEYADPAGLAADGNLGL